MGLPRFTVFTPAFNPGPLIQRTYESLRAQTFREFEWLVVDDGSTDNTRQSIQTWQTAAPFEIRYYFQPHQGKHRAHNLAVREAAGELFTVLDADDTIVPLALERLLFHWESIPPCERSRYSGIGCLCANSESRTIGRPFPGEVVDCRHYDIDARFGAIGEKWGFHRTPVLREFPFPEIPGERFCPEGLVWNRIAARYLVRHVNESLRIYHTNGTGLSANWATLVMRSPHGVRLFYRDYLGLPVPLWWKTKRAVNYVRVSLHARVPVRKILSDSPVAILAAIAAPAGAALYAGDRLRLKSEGCEA